MVQILSIYFHVYISYVKDYLNHHHFHLLNHVQHTLLNEDQNKKENMSNGVLFVRLISSGPLSVTNRSQHSRKDTQLRIFFLCPRCTYFIIKNKNQGQKIDFSESFLLFLQHLKASVSLRIDFITDINSHTKNYGKCQYDEN